MRQFDKMYEKLNKFYKTVPADIENPTSNPPRSMEHKIQQIVALKIRSRWDRSRMKEGNINLKKSLSVVKKQDISSQ